MPRLIRTTKSKGSAMTAGLSPDQITSYEANGFLCPVPIMDAAEARSNRDAVEALEQDFAGRLPKSVGEYLRISSYLATDIPLRVAKDRRILDKEQTHIPDISCGSCLYNKPHKNP